MDAAAVYRDLGPTDIAIDGSTVKAEHLSVTQTDQGSQKGVESYQMWVDIETGLLLRMDQDIRVSTDTPVGASTYTQKGTFTLASFVAHSG
jgi:hypothetical protein